MPQTDKYRVRISVESRDKLVEFNGDRPIGEVLSENGGTLLIQVDPEVYRRLCFYGQSPDQVIDRAYRVGKNGGRP